LFSAGLRRGDLLHNAFSYHFTPAGSMMESGAQALGCAVFPAGTSQTEQQVESIRDLRPTAYTGTPSFLRALLERAEEMGIRTDSLRKASVGGEALTPELLAWFEARNVAAYQSYCTADLGLIAYETTARQGLVVDEGVIVEIVRPGTQEQAEEGEVGEVVVTTLNPDYPLIRFGTGDLSATMTGICPTGRTNQRIRGWLGRADQSAKVRGLFVHPTQVFEILRRHPEIRTARLVIHSVASRDTLVLRVDATGSEALRSAVQQTVRDVTRLRCHVELVPASSLPTDGRVIEDCR
jgi:phenylacetate-CoA ligase